MTKKRAVVHRKKALPKNHQPGPEESADLMRANLAKLPDALRITFLHGFWEAMRYSCFSEQEKHGLRTNKHYMGLAQEIEKELDAATVKNAKKKR